MSYKRIAASALLSLRSLSSGGSHLSSCEGIQAAQQISSDMQRQSLPQDQGANILTV